MLLEPQSTEWDLRWSMFGIPVRVHPLFWLVGLLLGQSALEHGIAYLLAWIGCFFVSILIHELGHVLMGMIYGSRGEIVLYAFGGLAIGSNRLNNRWQRIAVSLAGPGAGFLFLIVVLGVMWVRNRADGAVYFALAASDLGISFPRDGELRRHLDTMLVERPLEFDVVGNLIFINLFWGLFNLLPIWPLDGGQACRELCDAADARRGVGVSLMISVAVAGFLCVCAILERLGRPILPFHFGSYYTAIMLGVLAWQSYQELVRIRSERRWMDDHWDR